MKIKLFYWFIFSLVLFLNITPQCFALDKAYVVFDTDDDSKSVIDNISVELDVYGYSGTTAVIVNSLGSPHLTWDDVNTLVNTKGWEITGHGMSSTTLTTMSIDAIISELNDSRNAYESRGYSVMSYTYPQCLYNSTAINVMMDYYPFGYPCGNTWRVSTDGSSYFVGTSALIDRYASPRFSIDYESFHDREKMALQVLADVVANNQSVIFFMHDIDYAQETPMLQNILSNISAYVSAGQMELVTRTQLNKILAHHMFNDAYVESISVVPVNETIVLDLRGFGYNTVTLDGSTYSATNILGNGNFEQGDYGNWSIVGGLKVNQGANVNLSDFEGLYALNLSNYNTTQNLEIDQDVTDYPSHYWNKVLSCSFYANANKNVDLEYYLAQYYIGGAYAGDTGTQTTSLVANEWTRITISDELGNGTNIIRYRIKNKANNNADILLDGFTCLVDEPYHDFNMQYSDNGSVSNDYYLMKVNNVEINTHEVDYFGDNDASDWDSKCNTITSDIPESGLNYTANCLWSSTNAFGSYNIPIANEDWSEYDYFCYWIKTNISQADKAVWRYEYNSTDWVWLDSDSIRIELNTSWNYYCEDMSGLAGLNNVTEIAYYGNRDDEDIDYNLSWAGIRLIDATSSTTLTARDTVNISSINSNKHGISKVNVSIPITDRAIISSALITEENQTHVKLKHYGSKWLVSNRFMFSDDISFHNYTITSNYYSADFTMPNTNETYFINRSLNVTPSSGNAVVGVYGYGTNFLNFTIKGDNQNITFTDTLFESTTDLWNRETHVYDMADVGTEFIINSTTIQKDLVIASVSYFNLTASSNARLYDTRDNIIDENIISEITTDSASSITFNSSQNYTGMNWIISSSGDKTNYEWYYRGHFDSDRTLIPSSNITYDGAYTIFNLTVDVGASSSSNEISYCIPPESGNWTINMTYNCNISFKTIDLGSTGWLKLVDDGYLNFSDSRVTAKNIDWAIGIQSKIYYTGNNVSITYTG